MSNYKPTVQLGCFNPINDFITYFGLDITKNCWMPTKHIPAYPNAEIRQILKSLGLVPQCQGELYIVRNTKICTSSLCLNPRHYKQVFRAKKPSKRILNLMDLASEIDLDTYAEIGEDLYIKHLNEGFPPDMWIKPKDFRQALRIKSLKL